MSTDRIHPEPVLKPLSGEVQIWVSHRHFDVVRREMDNSIATVGPNKSIGSIGVNGLLGALKLMWKHWWILRHSQSLVAVGHGGQIWIYIWRQPHLQDLLDTKRQMLESQGWPTTPRAFVERTRSETVAPKTPMYDLVADAYGDKLNPGRTDVLPHVEPEVLLEAFYRTVGFPDPSQVFFEIQAMKMTKAKQ